MMSLDQTEYKTARARIEAKIQELVDMLDLLDGDPDLEDDDHSEESDPAEDGGDSEPEGGL